MRYLNAPVLHMPVIQDHIVNIRGNSCWTRAHQDLLRPPRPDEDAVLRGAA